MQVCIMKPCMFLLGLNKLVYAMQNTRFVDEILCYRDSNELDDVYVSPLQLYSTKTAIVITSANTT